MKTDEKSSALISLVSELTINDYIPSLALPLALREAITDFPPLDLMRTKKPCVRALFTFEG